MKKIKLILLIVLIVTGVATLILLWRGGVLDAGGSKYQAVFLTNNQVYFGHIASSLNSSFITLKDVHYLQVDTPLQPVKGVQPQQNILLVPLGTRELHQPTNEMKINKNQIIFIEDLKPDSQVVSAIERLKSGQAQ